MSVPASDLRFIYVTCKDMEEARLIAQALLKQRLVACANIFPQIESIYEWQGEVRRDTESVVVLKTATEKVASAIKRIEELHSYDTPCALSLSIETGAEKYVSWLRGQV